MGMWSLHTAPSNDISLMLAYRPCAFSSLSGLENAHVMFYHPQTNVQVPSAADHSSVVFDELCFLSSASTQIDYASSFFFQLSLAQTASSPPYPSNELAEGLLKVSLQPLLVRRLEVHFSKAFGCLVRGCLLEDGCRQGEISFMRILSCLPAPFLEFG